MNAVGDQGAGQPRLVERALEALAATKTPFSTYSVITPANVRFLPRSADWLLERGAEYNIFIAAVLGDDRAVLSWLEKLRTSP